MNAILGFSSILNDIITDSTQRYYLEAIHRSGKTLLQLINDVLDLSKIEAGKLELELATFELGAVLDELIDLVAPEAQAKELLLRRQGTMQLPVTLRGDVTRLRQILLNLLSNAVKFTECGNVTLSAELIELTNQRATLICTVSDTGIGIPAERIEALFEPFIQGDSSTTRVYGGTGLGLTISRQLAHLMGGNIEVSSTVGQGASFRVAIPFDVCPSGNVTSDQEPVAPRAEEHIEPARILLVEDNATNQLVARTILQKQGHYVDVAANGAEALALLKIIPFNLVFMDCQMPVMDGFEATRRIRNGEAGNEQRQIPIVAMTAHAFEEVKLRCLENGMNDYMSKPVKASDLNNCVAQWRSNIPQQTAMEESIIYSAVPVDDCFDHAGLLRRLEGDNDLADEVVKMFLNSAPVHLETLHRAIMNGAAEEVAMQAHNFKGMARNCGAIATGNVTMQLEKIATAGILDGAEQLLKELELAFLLCRDEMVKRK